MLDKKILPVITFFLLRVDPLSCGTSYIPFWQHGYGMSYTAYILNTDVKTVMAEIYLIDDIMHLTYSTSEMIAPGDAWIVNSSEYFYGWWVGFGWGLITSTGDPSTTYAWGATHGTVSGKLTGIAEPSLTEGFSGTVYIPIWQHGLGLTYYNVIINSDDGPERRAKSC